MDGGLLSFQAAVAGGLVFDRTINQAALATSYQSHQGSYWRCACYNKNGQLSKEV